MADVLFRDLLDHVRLECPGCPEDVMVQFMLDVVRDFCQKSRAWIYEVDMETILQRVSDYDIEVPTTQAYPIAIQHMEVEGRPSIFKPTEWLDRHIPNWRLREADDFSMFTHITPRIITFPCVPQHGTKVGEWRYRVSLKPTTDAIGIPQELVDEWLDAFSDGTKAWLKMIPEKRWSDAKRGSDLEKDYRIARGEATIRANRSYGDSVDIWVGPKFA